LLEASSQYSDHSRKVRLLLDSGGIVHIESEILSDLVNSSEPARVCIAAQRTDPADPFLLHKTTRRDLYDSSFATATAAGFADAIFLNNRDEVTEGAISNLFIEKCGRWYTPPLECGVLPGVYRRHSLESRPEIQEKVLTMEELKAADGIYLSNAVRGLRRVVLDFNAIVGPALPEPSSLLSERS
jgi:para-aminobenzoate synthetase/4-amino-4-deoxychorismate lyase